MSGSGAGVHGRKFRGRKFGMTGVGAGVPGINFGGSNCCMAGDGAGVGEKIQNSPSPEFRLGADWNGGNWSTKNK